MDEMARAVRAILPDVWSLIRRGFVTRENGLEVHVLGAETPDDAEAITVRAIAHVLQPAQRAGVVELEALKRAALDEARALAFAAAEKEGRAVTLAGEEDRAALADAIPGEDLERRARPIAGAAVAVLDETLQRVVSLRFTAGKSEAEAAAAFGCGRAAIRSRERRVRHRVRHALAAELPEESFGRAAIDLLLGAGPLPAITAERMERDVLRRTHVEDAAPYAVRARWGLGAAAIAGAAYVLMLVFAR